MHIFQIIAIPSHTILDSEQNDEFIEFTMMCVFCLCINFYW